MRSVGCLLDGTMGRPGLPGLCILGSMEKRPGFTSVCMRYFLVFSLISLS